MLRRGLLALTLAAAMLGATSAPAHAIPPPPPGGDLLVVFAYYSSPAKTQLVGQQWHGCGQPAGSWGVTSPYRDLFFTPC